jgi:hypothetical protein
MKRYNYPIDIPPLQWTPTGYRRVTPRGIQVQEFRLQRRAPVPPPRRSSWLASLLWGTLNTIAFALIVSSLALIILSLLSY